jgi:hypothetical protein
MTQDDSGCCEPAHVENSQTQFQRSAVSVEA